MIVEGHGCYPASEPKEFTGTRPGVMLTIAKLGGANFVHVVVEGVAVLLDENHATALARILDGCVAEIQARAVSR